MARGSAISRVRDYFKSAPLDEVQVVFTLVQKDLAERTKVTSKPVVARRKQVRVARPPAAPATEAQIDQQEIA